MGEQTRKEEVFEVLQAGESRGAWFFRKPGRINIVVSCAISAVLAQVWISRLPLDLIVSPLFVVLVVLLTIPILRGDWASFAAYPGGELITIRYNRPGVSWSGIIQAQLGCALLYTMAHFFFTNTIIGSRLLGDATSVLAAASILLLFPVLPLIAHEGKLPVLKTSIDLHINRTGLQLRGNMKMRISVLDLAWAGKEEDADLQASILARFTDLMTNHAELIVSSPSITAGAPSDEA